MLEFLSDNLKAALSYLNVHKLNEIRVRADCPVSVQYGGTYAYLTPHGVKNTPSPALIIGAEEIGNMVYRACDKSVYAVTEELKQGFVSLGDGVRIGIGGTYVSEGGRVIAVRDFTSLCIRVPHNVGGCSEVIQKVCFQRGIPNLLIFSPPGGGKTTMLKDIALFLSRDVTKNLLLCDERGELASFGKNADVISFADKRTAFLCGIRALRPDVIVTDELTREDYLFVRHTIGSGVKVLASAHLFRIEDVPERLFDYYVALDGETPGRIRGIYGGEGESVYA